MKIIKFGQYITEMKDTPESYINTKLNMIKHKIEKFFIEGSILSEMGVGLENIDMSKYSTQNDSLTIKFSDELNTYTMIIYIDIDEILTDEDFKLSDIKNCYIKFKKYTLIDIELVGQITKTIEIDNINDDLIIDLKLEIDETFGE